MRVTSLSDGQSFKHKIFIDIGASNPKGTLKITAIKNDGGIILKENSPNSYVNNTIRGFDDAKDFIDKVAKIIKRTHDRVLLKHKSGECPLSLEDKLLAGVTVFVPGTTSSLTGADNGIAFMPNLCDKNQLSLTNIDFHEYETKLRTQPANITGVNVNQEKFNLVVTKDLGGTGVALAQMMAKNNMLNDGDYIMGVMTGGGFGSVDIKVKNNLVEFETSESSSYVSGNFGVFDSIVEQVKKVIDPKDPQSVENLSRNNNEFLKNHLQIVGKLGRHGVNVKSHIESFCNELNRKDLIKILQAVGDARIVEMNRMCVSEKDVDLLQKIRSMKDEFVEIESTTDGKIAFEMNEKHFNAEALKNARTVAVNDYANSISLISINKINDGANKVVLMGPFAHGVNQYIKIHNKDFDGAKDLPELILNKIKMNIDKQHIDLPSTQKLMQLYNFEIICDSDLNIPNNTVSGDLFLDPKFKFIPNRGNWFSVPLSTLKKSQLIR